MITRLHAAMAQYVDTISQTVYNLSQPFEMLHEQNSPEVNMMIDVTQLGPLAALSSTCTSVW
jgi:hypothetical protein